MAYALMIGTILLAILGVYLILVIYDAKHDVRTAPRTDMFICDKHGALPAKSLINFTLATGDPQPYCPLCLEDRFQEAKKV